jgi:predicted O-methyltransferase YrrM
MLLLLGGLAASASFMGPAARTDASSQLARSRAAAPVAQFGFKVQKSERLLIREAWERADAYRPGKPNWFTQQPKDLVELHKTLLPELDALPLTDPVPGRLKGNLPGAGNRTSLLGALLKSLTTGDLALTLCSKEPPVLTELRDWLITALTMPEAVCGLPEEQGRVLSTLAKAMDARKMLDLGTFTGYSSIAMALATADDAKVICCEPDVKYGNHARDWWLKAGCAEKMVMHEREAEPVMEELLAEGAEGTFDMIFVDAGRRERYPAIHELAMRLVHVGGVVVYYDTLWPADEVLQHSYYPSMREFNMQLAQDPRVLASLVPLSYGITIAFKTMNLDGEALAQAKAPQQAGNGDDALRELLARRRAEAQAELDAM